MYYLTCFSLSLQYLFYLYLNINKHTSLYEKYINIFNKYCNFSVECFYRTNLEPYFTHAKKIIQISNERQLCCRMLFFLPLIVIRAYHLIEQVFEFCRYYLRVFDAGVGLPLFCMEVCFVSFLFLQIVYLAVTMAMEKKVAAIHFDFFLICVILVILT